MINPTKIKSFLFVLFTFTLFIINAQIPYGYYDAAVGKQHEDLKQTLHEIISDNSTLEYTDLWTYFSITDKKSNGKVWDIYSDTPDTIPPYEYQFGNDQCGNYNQEGDCFNREHSVPNSWFGGKQYPMYSDLFHLYPVDGWVNNKRDNFPYGKVATVTWTSLNGSKLGTSASEGYTGTVFEPIDEYKGDLARTYFYMSLRYQGVDFSQNNFSQFVGSELAPWALKQLIQWHIDDPVSEKETDRNNRVYNIQNNRNPFIDFPELVSYLWGEDTLNIFAPYIISNVKQFTKTTWQIYPNPAHNQLTLSTNDNATPTKVEIVNMVGKVVLNQRITNFSNSTQLDISTLVSGFYIINIISNNDNKEVHKLIIW